MDQAPRLLFTPGDPAGVGPEVVLRAIAILRENSSRPMTLVGPGELWDMAAGRLDLTPPSTLDVDVVTPGLEGAADSISGILFAGRSTTAGAKLALSCLESAADILGDSPLSTALVTGPVNKHGLHDI